MGLAGRRARQRPPGAFLVGRRGFEPLTFSVSGRRAPAAPTAQDDESLPDLVSGGGHHDEPAWRAVQVSAGQIVLALDQAKRGVARQAQQPANTLAARELLIRAAGVVMVDEDRLVFLERGVAHRAGVLLDLQDPVELLPGQAVANQPVRLIPPTLGGGVDGPSVASNARRKSLAGGLHRLGRRAGSSVPRCTGARGPLARHPLAAQLSGYTLATR